MAKEILLIECGCGRRFRDKLENMTLLGGFFLNSYNCECGRVASVTIQEKDNPAPPLRKVGATEAKSLAVKVVERDCDVICVTKIHAYSLSELVKYSKKMIEQGKMPEQPGRSDELTAGYCDELLEDLNDR